MKKFYLLFLFSIICATTSAQLVLTEALFDPAGSASGDLHGDANGSGARSSTTDEFLEFVNNSGGSLDISGYQIFEETVDDDGAGPNVASTVLLVTIPTTPAIPDGETYLLFAGGSSASEATFEALPGVTTDRITLSNIATTLSAIHVFDASNNHVLTFNPTEFEADGPLDPLVPGATELNIDGLDLDMALNQSLQRSPTSTDSFILHSKIDGKYFSPGVKEPTQFVNSQLLLNEVLSSPLGDANGDSVTDANDDEFIEIVNNSGGIIDIGGYQIYDESTYRFNTPRPKHTFPSPTILNDGDVLVVFGGGAPTGAFGGATVQTANGTDGNLGINNTTADTIYITDGSGLATLGNIVSIYNFDSGDFTEGPSNTRLPVLTGSFIKHNILDGANFSPGLVQSITNILILNEIGADPETSVDDINNDGTISPNEDEFLEFVNNSGAPLDISDFKLYDLQDFNNSLTSHVFPSGTIIPDGGAIVVFDNGSPAGTFGDAIVQTCDGASTNGFTLLNGGATIVITNTSNQVVFADLYEVTENGGDINTSLTRSPDITGTSFIKHTDAPGGAKFTPGRKIDGTPFIARNIYSGTGDWNNGANWSLGLPTSTSNLEIPTGNSVTVTSDNEVANNLEVKGTLVINSTESLTVNGSIEVSGTATINSGGSLIVSETSLGNLTYNRELTFEAGDLKGWHTVGSPVIGQAYNNTYANTNGLATSTTDVTKRGIGTYDIPNNAWAYLTTADANSGTFGSGIGYTMKRGATTGDVAFTGTLNTNNAGVDVGLLITGDRFNPLANPYTSYVSSATFLTNESAISETQTLWVWNQGNGTNGEYEVMGIPEAMVIAPGQGFFVKANAAGGTFNFTEGNQTHNAGTDTFQKSAGKTEIKLWITDGAIKNYNKIYYLDNTTTGFDVGYDGEIFNSSSPFAIYSHLVSDNQGKNYQLQSLPNSDYENMIVPLGLNAAAGKEITFTTEALNLPTGIKVFLEDKLTNTFTRLDEANSNYKVTLTDKSEGTGRFYLHTKASVLSTDTFGLENISIYKTNNSNLKIAGVFEGKASIKLFNILGKQVLNTSFRANGNNDISLPKLATGIYIVQLETEKGNINKKINLE